MAAMYPAQPISRLAIWIAILAVLAGSVMPSVSHLLASWKGPVWAQMCSTSGTRFVALGDLAPKSPLGDMATDHTKHCPFCLNHGGSLGLPPAAPLTLPLLAGTSLLPLQFYQSHRPLFAWATAQPRGPPVIA